MKTTPIYNSFTTSILIFVFSVISILTANSVDTQALQRDCFSFNTTPTGIIQNYTIAQQPEIHGILNQDICTDSANDFSIPLAGFTPANLNSNLKVTINDQTVSPVIEPIAGSGNLKLTIPRGSLQPIERSRPFIYLVFTNSGVTRTYSQANYRVYVIDTTVAGDFDSDTVSDAVEFQNGKSSFGYQLIDALNDDDDRDGIPTRTERLFLDDSNNDGTADYLDPHTSIVSLSGQNLYPGIHISTNCKPEKTPITSNFKSNNGLIAGDIPFSLVESSYSASNCSAISQISITRVGELSGYSTLLAYVDTTTNTWKYIPARTEQIQDGDGTKGIRVFANNLDIPITSSLNVGIFGRKIIAENATELNIPTPIPTDEEFGVTVLPPKQEPELTPTQIYILEEIEKIKKQIAIMNARIAELEALLS